MADIEGNVLRILQGQQHNLPIAVDHTDKTDATFQPIIKNNICYIVACVVINEDDEVVMMQEAKESCYGRWYLPAGRVEANESLIDAAKREMKEETGLEFLPETLVYVEVQQSFWYRFTFTGRIIGGDLKTPDQKDEESLQAKWVPAENIDTNEDYPLRSTDIVTPIKMVKQYMSREEKIISGINISLKAHNNLYIRLLISQIFPDSKIVKIITSGNKSKNLPTTIAGVRRPFSQPISKLLSLIFKDLVCAFPKVLGVLNLEHDGSQEPAKDGCCFTLLVSVGNNTDTVLELQKKYSWVDIKNRELSDILERKLTPDSPSLCGIKLAL